MSFPARALILQRKNHNGEGKECGPHKGFERQGFEPRSQGARVQKALFRAPAFLRLSTEILEGCGLRRFAPSELSPWPARKNVAVMVKVLSQVVGGYGASV